jgi:phage FluMu protein Com
MKKDNGTIFISCPSCKEMNQVNIDSSRMRDFYYPGLKEENITFYKEIKCNSCNNDFVGEIDVNYKDSRVKS